MPNEDTPIHTYNRAVSNDSHDSLAIIANLIEDGQSVLDLGMGTGALGRYLNERSGVVIDGITMNPEEADIARTWYRRAMLADLDRDDIATMVGDQLYDCIVCADVLEHLKAPQNLLAQCKLLLTPDGRLLTSVPNAAYCGLLAELIQGDFRYRQEGLLDRTHLRFYTRTSLQRFFLENDWQVQSTQTTQRSLLESEFRVAFDVMPPAVSRHLLALPDALTYQFISVLRPLTFEAKATRKPLELKGAESEVSTPANALFSAELFLATHNGYDEATKVVVPGCIGDPKQILAFEIPTVSVPYTGIRFDPADRPGFFRLHYIKLSLSDGESIWQWHAGQDHVSMLTDAPQQQILVASPWETSNEALLLLHGDDPWMELPLSTPDLKKISEMGAKLEVCAGWPMSADFLQASASVNDIKGSYQRSLKQLQQTVDSLQSSNDALQSSNDALQSSNDVIAEARNAVQIEVEQLTHVLKGSKDEKRILISSLHSTQRERNAMSAQFNQIAGYLQGIEQSTLFRATRPLVNMKMRLDRLMGRGGNQTPVLAVKAQNQAVPISPHSVDIIVPVFRGLEETRCCLESVLSSSCQTNWRLIIINDCSPEPEVTEWLRFFALKDPRIELLENAENLGFVATVNRGMSLSQQNDVLLLNSDAEVANDWLDRIQHAAYSGLRVASVTPFSNNATICSYPRFCESNDLPHGHTTATLDRLFALHLAGQSVEVPTGVGFCMYIRRQCLNEIGLFDVDNFGKGYGEENDFCIRAQEAGWTNLHALDTFVRHAGGVSFGDTKSARELLASETMRRLHPRYESEVHTFVQQDPARSARLIIDIARMTTSGHPVILNISHNREGGTLRHMQELAHQLSDQAIFLRLSPAQGGSELRLEGKSEAFALHFALPLDHHTLVKTLIQLQVSHIHYHHLLGHSPDIADLPNLLGVTHDFTAHDYYSYCPQISLTDHTDRYCGELGLVQCRDCLKRNPAPGGETIESWRHRHSTLLSQARYLITPSEDVAQRMQRFVPTACIQVVPHSTLSNQIAAQNEPTPRLLRAEQPLKIVVLGALSKIKGADILEDVAILASRHNVPVEFHLLGYAYRKLHTQPKARLTVHGGYEEKDLPLLLQWLQPDVVWFPAQCPETYSYTLSASLQCGLPIVAPNIGAFTERLQNRKWTWLQNWENDAKQWLDFFAEIRRTNFICATEPEPTDPYKPPAATRLQTEESTLSYSNSYLEYLPIPIAPDTLHLIGLQQEFSSYLKNPGTAVKSVALRTLLRLRSSRILSPLAKTIPTHLQRRFKSWLQS